ncbi:hypothetical protein ABW20_dc0105084 [Dactylellina cionopaga]|nr:hypothetical protein ABW20_dc0105084 [Dactylellina cionopaga]
MGSTQEAQTWTHRALLIGVGVHIDNIGGRRTDRSVEGAVPDIDAVSNYLETGPHDHIKITKLTATKPTEGNNRDQPIERPEDLPTRDNVDAALNRIIDEGSHGQIKHVYIHFSGHGTRIGKDEVHALVLYHPIHGKCYLRTTLLANRLEKMVKQGMHITVVLDCCYSASARRGDNLQTGGTRFVEYDPTADDHDETKLSGWSLYQEVSDGLRDSTLKVNRILNPNGYTVIAACGPDEKASELKFDGGLHRGALSYFLVQTLVALRKSGTRISYRSLSNHLQARFHARYQQQNPMFYGGMNTCFFQDIGGGTKTPFTSVFYDRNNCCFILCAGEAHGVHVGDTYTAYEYHESEERSELRQRSIALAVRTVKGLTSEVAAADPSHTLKITEGLTWKAVPTTSFSRRKINVRLMPSLSDSDRKQLQQHLQGHLFLRASEAEDNILPAYTVSPNAKGDFEIRDGNFGNISNLPAIPCGKDNALATIANTLGHLTLFKFFEGMENAHPDPNFESSFLLELRNDVGSDGWFAVENGGDWILRVKNISNNPIYVTIFNFRPSWRVSNINAEEGEGDYQKFAPKGQPESEDDFILGMNIPDDLLEAGQDFCEDIMKVFITSEAASFPCMLLPGIPFDESSGSVIRDSYDQASKFLAMFMRGFCGTRYGGRGQWTTRNYLIRTYKKLDVTKE